MPLIKGKSQKTFVKNLKTELNEGKPMKQSLAIAYNMKRKGKKKMAEGGSVEDAQASMRKAFKYADGGEVLQPKKKSLAQEASEFFNKMGAMSKAEPEKSKEDKYADVREQNKKNMGYSKGGVVYNVTSPYELLHMQEDANEMEDSPMFDVVPTQINKAHVANNSAAKSEDAKRLGQHYPDMQASTSPHEEDLVERIMARKSKDFSGLDRLAHGGPVDASGGDGPYEDDEDGLVNRIMHKRSEPFENLDRYSKGGMVANDTGTGQEADKLPNQYDDLVLRDELESSYGVYDNAGDDRGNEQEDEDRKDIVARIMASRRKKDRLPSPA